MASVPDKRNPSKQRRAARNRASRDALAARRENAVITTSTPASAAAKPAPSGGSSSRGSTKGATRGAAARGAGSRPVRPVPVAVGPPPQGIGGYLRSRRPGDKAILLAFLLSFVSAIALLFVLTVTVDDRGDGLPPQYGALTIAARQAITGSENVTEDTSTLSAYGPVALLMAATPVLIAGYAVWANRRSDRARLLTFALIAMAIASVFTGGLTIFLPTLIALGVGTFRIRKADMEAGMAAAPAPAAGRGEVIDAESVEDDAGAPAAPKSLLQRLLGPGAAAGGARRSQTGTAAAEEADDDRGGDAEDADSEAADAHPTDADADADPLAELEAELAAEAEAEQDTADGDDAPSGNGPGRRRR